MKTTTYKGKEVTTVSEITMYLTKGIDKIYKGARQYVMSTINQSNLKLEEDYFKLTKNEIKNNLVEISPVLKNNHIPHTGLYLIRTSSIDKIIPKVIFPIKKMIKGTYESDRYYAKRKQPFDELKYRLNNRDKTISNNLFKALLSTIGRMEKGQNKANSIRAAANKFNVTQVEIKRELRELELQIEHEALKKSQNTFKARAFKRTYNP